MEDNKACDCLLGILKEDGEHLHRSTIVEIILDRVTISRDYRIHGLISKAYTVKDFTTPEGGVTEIFNYCPKCGEKIDWDKIREKFKHGK